MRQQANFIVVSSNAGLGLQQVLHSFSRSHSLLMHYWVKCIWLVDAQLRVPFVYLCLISPAEKGLVSSNFHGNACFASLQLSTNDFRIHDESCMILAHIIFIIYSNLKAHGSLTEGTWNFEQAVQFRRNSERIMFGLLI